MDSNKKKISLDLLEQIQKVDAPPFLFTRLKQKIENNYTTSFSLRLTWSIGVSFILILVLNFIAINKSLKQTKGDNNLVISLNLMPDNSFYK